MIKNKWKNWTNVQRSAVSIIHGIAGSDSWYRDRMNKKILFFRTQDQQHFIPIYTNPSINYQIIIPIKYFVFYQGHSSTVSNVMKSSKQSPPNHLLYRYSKNNFKEPSIPMSQWGIAYFVNQAQSDWNASHSAAVVWYLFQKKIVKKTILACLCDFSMRWMHHLLPYHISIK